MSDEAKRAFTHAFARDFDPMHRLLDLIGKVDMWWAQCADARDEIYLRGMADAKGFAPAPDGSQEREAGRGRVAVNRQLHHVLRAALIRFARGTVAKLSAAERPKSLSIDRLGSLVKEAEVHNHREKLGDRHPTTLVAINNLAGLHMANGEMALAESLYRECLQARRETLGAHPTTVISISNLGTLLSERGDFQAAIPLVQVRSGP